MLQAIGTRTGSLRQGGIVDEEAAARTVVQAFRDGRLGLWALDDMGLLFRGNENMAALPGPDDRVSALPLASSEVLTAQTRQDQLAEPEIDQSMALIASPTSVPSLITPDSPTATQISTFVAAHFEVQRRSLTELSTSKNQVKKRELQVKNEERKQKWKSKYPNLAKTTSKISRGVGVAKGASRPFYIGGNVLKRRIERARTIARKVDKKRAKRRK